MTADNRERAQAVLTGVVKQIAAFDYGQARAAIAAAIDAAERRGADSVRRKIDELKMGLRQELDAQSPANPPAENLNHHVFDDERGLCVNCGISDHEAMAGQWNCAAALAPRDGGGTT